MRTVPWLWACVVLTGLNISLCGASAESLVDAFKSALANNPTIEAQRSATQASKETVTQAKATFYPTVAAQGTLSLYTYQNYVPASGYPDIATINKTPNAYAISVNANLNVFNGFQSVSTLKAARSSNLVQDLTLRDTEQSILLQAAQAYYAVWYDRAAVQLSRANLSFAQAQCTLTRNMKDAGSATEADLASARANYYAAQAALAQAQTAVTTSESQYEQIIGHRPATVSEPVDVSKLMPGNEDDVLSKTLAQNPSLLASVAQQRVAKAQIDVNKSAFYPTVDIQASYQYAHNPAYNIDQEYIGTIAGVVNVPLFVGGGNVSKMRQAKDLYAQAQYNVEAIRRQVRANVHTLWEQNQSNQSLVDAYKKTVKASQLALKDIEDGYKAGAQTFTNVLQAQSSLLSAQTNLLQAQQTACLTGFSILQAMGQLNLDILSTL